MYRQKTIATATLVVLSLFVPVLVSAQTLFQLQPSSLVSSIGTAYVYDGNGSETWSKAIGDSTLGAELEVKAGWWSNESKRGVYGDIEGNVLLFGNEYEAAGIHAKAYNDYTNGTAELDVDIAGFTLVDKSWSTDSKTYSWSFADEISKSDTFLVGPVPVTVSVGAGFDVSGDLEFGTTLTGVGVSGVASASAFGEASAGVGASLTIWGYKVAEISLKVVATLEFFSVDLTLDAAVEPAGVTGDVSLGASALTLELEIVATFQILWWNYSYSLEILDVTYASVSKTLFSF